MSNCTVASSDCSRPANNHVRVNTADLYTPNARFTPERQGYQVLTLFGKLGYSPSVHPVYVIPPLLWVSWVLVYTAGQRSGPGSVPARILAGWGRIDVGLATGLIYLALFRVPPLAAAFGITVVAVYVLVRWVTGRMQTAPLRYAVGISTALLLSVLVLRGGLEIFVRAVVGRVYDLTVDHRLRPDQDEINEDGIRFGSIRVSQRYFGVFRCFSWVI